MYSLKCTCSWQTCKHTKSCLHHKILPRIDATMFSQLHRSTLFFLCTSGPHPLGIWTSPRVRTHTTPKSRTILVLSIQHTFLNRLTLDSCTSYSSDYHRHHLTIPLVQSDHPVYSLIWFLIGWRHIWQLDNLDPHSLQVCNVWMLVYVCVLRGCNK